MEDGLRHGFEVGGEGVVIWDRGLFVGGGFSGKRPLSWRTTAVGLPALCLASPFLGEGGARWQVGHQRDTFRIHAKRGVGNIPPSGGNRSRSPLRNISNDPYQMGKHKGQEGEAYISNKTGSERKLPERKF